MLLLFMYQFLGQSCKLFRRALGRPQNPSLFCFLCWLGQSLFKPHKNESNSGSCSQKTTTYKSVIINLKLNVNIFRKEIGMLTFRGVAGPLQANRSTWLRVKGQLFNCLWRRKLHFDNLSWNSCIERFSFECRKVIGFVFATLHDWLKKFAPILHPIRSKTKPNRESLSRFFRRFGSATCNYFEFWLVHCFVCVLCDWLEQLLWF